MIQRPVICRSLHQLSLSTISKFSPWISSCQHSHSTNRVNWISSCQHYHSANRVNEGNISNRVNEGNISNRVNERNISNRVNERNISNPVNERNIESHRIHRPTILTGWRHPYLRMYPWRSLRDFVDVLHDNIVYEDEDIVAIDKPWGVGIHAPGLTVHKTNAHLLQMESFGHPHFCIDEALPELEVKLRTDRLEEMKLRTDRLKVVKGIDRFESGLMLLSKTLEGERRVKKAIRTARTMGLPYMTYWCICRGYPIMERNPGHEIERVGIKLLEVDELGDYKEPIIVKNFSKTALKMDDEMKVVRAQCRVLQSSHKFSSSLLQISCDSIKWRFVQSFAAFKTSFVLGDVRFSKRVAHVLGNPVTFSPSHMDLTGHSHYEPLHVKVRQRLRVARNSEIPIMIHRRKILLPNYDYGKKEPLLIESRSLPPHFEWTAKSLDLLSFNPELAE